ncbi:MAG: hypothetical protein Q7J47_17985 [Azoarcus sp.]|nr:hypothetical protein [Azoarcus sp.]
MSSRPSFRIALRTLALGLIVAHAHAADDTDAGAGRIDQLKAEAKHLRDQAETTFQAAESSCYGRFMVNRCIDQAKQARLDAIRSARELESEARKLELAERQRAAAEVMQTNPGAPLTPASPSPAADAVITPTPEAERLRADRERVADQAETDARAAQAAKDVERARERSKADAAAAQRAEQAARERARYEERIREYEEKKARDAAGR